MPTPVVQVVLMASSAPRTCHCVFQTSSLPLWVPFGKGALGSRMAAEVGDGAGGERLLRLADEHAAGSLLVRAPERCCLGSVIGLRNYERRCRPLIRPCQNPALTGRGQAARGRKHRQTVITDDKAKAQVIPEEAPPSHP